MSDGRRILQIAATMQGVVYALCVDGTIWMLPDTLPVGSRALTGADWRQLPAIPFHEGGDEWGAMASPHVAVSTSSANNIRPADPAPSALNAMADGSTPPIAPVLIRERVAEVVEDRLLGRVRFARLKRLQKLLGGQS